MTPTLLTSASHLLSHSARNPSRGAALPLRLLSLLPASSPLRAFCPRATARPSRASCSAYSTSSAMADAADDTSNSNPLLADFDFPPFDRVEPAHVRPGIRALLARLEGELEELEKGVEPAWVSEARSIRASKGQTSHIVRIMEEMQKSLQEMLERVLSEAFDKFFPELKTRAGEGTSLHARVGGFHKDLDAVKQEQVATPTPQARAPPPPPPANRAARFAYCGPPAPWDSTGATADTTAVQEVVVHAPQADALGTPTSCSTGRLTQVVAAPQQVGVDSVQELRSESRILKSPTPTALVQGFKAKADALSDAARDFEVIPSALPAATVTVPQAMVLHRVDAVVPGTDTLHTAKPPALECTSCQAKVYDPLPSWERNGFSPGNIFAKSGHTLDLVRCSLCAILDSRVRWKLNDAPLIFIGCSPGRLTYGLDYKGNICGSKHGDPDLSELDSKPSLDYHVVQNIEPGMSTVSCYGMPWDSGLPGSFMLWDPGIQLHISVNRSCLDCLRGCTRYEEDYNAAVRQETIGLVKADVNFTYYMVALLLPMMTFLLEFFLLYSVAQDLVIRHSYAQCKRAHLSVSRPEKGKSVALNSGCSAMVSWMAPIAYSHFLPKPWQPAQERYEHASTARSAIIELPPSATMPSNKVVVPYSSIEVTLVTTNSKVLQFISHLSHTPSSSLVNALRNYSVMWCLADAFLRLIKWWSDTQCVQPSRARFEALFSAEPRSTEIPTQVLVVGSVLHLFCSKAAPSYLMTDFLVGGHQLKSIWGAQCVPCVSIKEEKSAKLFHICAAAVVVIPPAKKLCSADEKTVLLFVHHVLEKIELWQWSASPGKWELHMCDELHTIAVVEGIASSMSIASLLEHSFSSEELGYTSDGRLVNFPYDLVQIGWLARFTTPTVFLGDTLLNFYGCCSSVLVATPWCFLYNKVSSLLGAVLIAYSRILEFKQAHLPVKPWDPGIIHFLPRTEVVAIRKRTGHDYGGLADSQKSSIERDCNFFHQMLVNRESHNMCQV